ncbi:unnamed protein product [Cunninghamella blakesleeana]
MKTVLNEKLPFDIWDWRSIVETDGPYGWHQMVETRQVITRLDKHTSVCRVKMKDKWQLGSQDRTVIEHVIQHTDYLRYYSIGVERDDPLQIVCLDIQSRTNQTNQYYHVICYHQWKMETQSTIPISLFEDYSLSMIKESITILNTHGSIPFISRQDLGIDIGLNSYESTTKTLNLEYQYQPNQPNNSDDTIINPRIKSPTIDIQRSILPPLHSRSWGQQDYLLHSSLRKNEFVSSSLRLNPSSPGSYARSTTTLSRKISFPSSNHYLPSPLLLTSDTSKKGEEIDICFDGLNASTVYLQLQLFYANGEKIDPLITNQFAQLCLRCFRHLELTSRYTIALQHPTTLIDDLNLSEDTILTIQLSLQIENKSSYLDGSSSSNNSNKTDSLIQLLLNGKQWPVRDSMPWDIAANNNSDNDDLINDSDIDIGIDIDDGGSNRKGSTIIPGNIDDQELDDPFMSSMEDIHELNKTNQQINSSTVFSTRASMPNILAPSAKPSHNDTVPILKTSSSVRVNELTRSSSTTTRSSSITPTPKPSLTFLDNTKNNKTNKYNLIENDKSNISNATSSSKKPKQMTIEIKKEKNYKRPLSSGKRIIIPHADPPALTKAYQYMDSLLHSDNWQITQKPEPNNGFATIKKMDVEGHPTGALFCECAWHHCSIWDVKAVLNCSEAREIWDPMFEKGEFICSITPSCSIWHCKLKGAWPASPRDYVAFTSQYTSCQRIDICSTSCISDTYEYYALPKETSDYVRAKLDLSGWRLDYIDNVKKTSVSVRYVLQTHFQGWIPWYLLNQLTTQAPNVPTSAYQFFKKHGAPPSLEELELATMQQLRYDHTRKHWRLEYIRSITIGEEGPTKSTVRLDRRRWAYFSSQYSNGTDSSHYNVTIDPPPSSVVAQVRKDDPYGVWLMIEHDESFIIPIRAKILVLIKPNLPLQQTSKQKLQQAPKKQRKTEVFLVVNGVSKPVEDDNNIFNEELDPIDAEKNEKSASVLTDAAPSPLISPNSSTPLSSTQISPSTSSTIISDDQLLEKYIQQLSITPMEQAQAAFIFLKRMDEQFGWTVISDKQGLRINKRNGSKVSSTKEKNESTLPLPSSSSSSSSLKDHHYLDVSEPYVIYKASKVIEKYSMEEVASVITNISDTRLVYDSSIENCTAIKSIQRGCKVIRQEIKSIFPFKSRELYMVSCVAVENIRGPPSSQRILYVESSLDIPVLKSSKLPRGKMFVSGWLLEPIDPYTTATNHPIPSMRATYIIALDLGTSIPSYISNMVANGIASKKIQWVERYLKEKGPLPYLTYPLPAVGLKKNKCIDIQLLDNERNNNDKIITTTKDSIDENVNNNNNNNYDNDTNDNRPNSITQPTNTPTRAAKTTMITTGTHMSTMKWRDIQTIYGQHPLLKVICQCQYQQYKPPSTPPVSSTTPITIPSSSPTSVSALQVQPSASQSASWIDRRHSTISYAHSISNQRRGSLPSSTLTTSSSTVSSSTSPSTTTATTNATTSTLASAAVAAARNRKLEIENEKKNNNNGTNYHNMIKNMIIDPILMEVVVDLQSFDKGYDVMVEFYQDYDDSDTNNNINNDANIKDLSGLLCVNVSELTPTPSYLLLATDSSNKTPPPGKHLIQIKLLSSALSQTIFQPKDKDIFNLIISLKHHVQEKKKKEDTNRLSDDSYINNASDRLTMSGVLGEDDDEEVDDNDNSLKETLSKYSNNQKDKKDDTTSKWHGHVYVDGKKVLKYGEDIKISRIQQQDLSSLSASSLHTSLSSSTLNNNATNTNTDDNNTLDHNKSLLLQQLQLKQKNNKASMIDEDNEANDNSSVSSCYSTSTDDEITISRTNSPHQNVFSAALGGVNGFRMRMLFPFQNSLNSSSNISSQESKTESSIEKDNIITNTGDMSENDLKEIYNDGDNSNNDIETDANNSNEIIRKRNRRRTGTFDGKSSNDNGVTLSSLNMNASSTSHDTNSNNISNWSVILWIIMILLCFICVVTLLLLQPRLVTFDAQSPIYSLIRLPWFKGWELHVVISKSSSLS